MLNEVLALAGLRGDGRRHTELREMRVSLGITPEDDGSACVQNGLTRVIASVRGPRERSSRTAASDEVGVVKVNYFEAPFSGNEHKRNRPGGGNKDKKDRKDRKTIEIEGILCRTFSAVIQLDLFPKSEVSISVRVFESDGSLICAAINAITLALLDAGVPMSDMPVACSVGVARDGQLLRDLTRAEQSACAFLPACVEAASARVLYLQLDSRIPAELLEKALEEAVEGCQEVRGVMEEAAKNHLAEALLN